MGLFRWWSEIRGRREFESDTLATDAQYVVLDTELTGLDDRKDDIVSIGAVRMRGGKIEIGDAFHELVNPSAVLDGRSVVIHGITPSQVEAKPPIDVVLATFMDYVARAVLVGHCVSIDLAFLNREARRLTGGSFKNPVVDTLSLYGWLRHRFPENPALTAALPGLSLFELARLFDIPVAEGHTLPQTRRNSRGSGTIRTSNRGTASIFFKSPRNSAKCSTLTPRNLSWSITRLAPKSTPQTNCALARRIRNTNSSPCTSAIRS